MPLFEFRPVAEFEDRLGIIRSISPCSLLGREEFKQRMLEIQDRLADAEGDIWDIYDRDKYLQFLIQRCLELNGVDPDWVNLPLVEKLLFSDGENPGWLTQVNLRGTIAPAEGTGKPSKDEPMDAIELIGLLAQQRGMAEAIELARTVPADLLVGAMDAQSLWANPKEMQRRKVKQKFSKKSISKDELDRLLDTPVEELPEAPL